MLHNPKTILHTFRSQPCALFVLIALFMPDCPDPVGEKWLARRTGYTRKTVRESGLYFLEDMEIIQRAKHRRGWTLSAQAKQLPLPFPGLPGAVAGNVLEAGEGKIYPHGPTTATTTNYRKAEEDTAAAAAGEGKIYPHENGEGKVYPHEPDLSPQLSTAQQAISDYLRSQGIGDPTCNELAQLHWVSLDYAKAHVAHGRENGDRLALVIHRIRSHDPAPAMLIPPDTCPKCGYAIFNDSGQCLVCTGIVVH